MKPYYKIESGTLYNGHVLETLQNLKSESVQTCVTSPPYWGLRDYGTEAIIWGGDSNCKHKWGKKKRIITGRTDGDNDRKGRKIGAVTVPKYDSFQGQFCKQCDAWRGELGLEPTPELYVQHIVEIFREVKRVLKNDGTLWLNLGDSYAGGGKAGKNPDLLKNHKMFGKPKSEFDKSIMMPPQPVPDGLKPKDMVGIPWRVAFALQADGWYLRSDIIWHKPNGMPSAVKDRPTNAHEYIFLLSKKNRYYYDYEVIKVASTTKPNNPGRKLPKKAQSPQKSFEHQFEDSDRKWGSESRNKRSVWKVPNRPFKKAHFATFPEKLILPCILAGCPEGGVVLDPFFGAGTVGVVTRKKKRKFLGIELNKGYCKMASKRIEKINAKFNLKQKKGKDLIDHLFKKRKR